MINYGLVLPMDLDFLTEKSFWMDSLFGNVPEIQVQDRTFSVTGCLLKQMLSNLNGIY